MLESDENAGQLRLMRATATATCLVAYAGSMFVLFRHVCFPLLTLDGTSPATNALGPCLTALAVTGIALLVIGAATSWRLEDGRALVSPATFLGLSVLLIVPAGLLLVASVSLSPDLQSPALWYRVNFPASSPLLVYAATVVQALVTRATVRSRPRRSFVLAFVVSWGATTAFVCTALVSRAHAH